jgi:hypothetical protein
MDSMMRQQQGGGGFGGWPQMGGWGMGGGYQPQAPTGAMQGDARIDKLRGRVSNLQEQMKGAGTEQMAGIQARMDQMQGRIKGLRQDRRQGEGLYAQPQGQAEAGQMQQQGGGQDYWTAARMRNAQPMPMGGGMNFGGMPWGMPNMGGQRAWMQPQMMPQVMPQGGYNPQAGQQQGLAAPQGKMPAGTPVAPRPQQGGNTGSSPMPVGANGTSSHPGLIWWNGVEILDVGNYTDQWGNITTRDAYAQRRKDLAKFGPGGMLDGSMFKTKFGDLVQSSNGNSNIYKVNGGGENDLYHYDPQEGWKHMTADEYQKYGDYNYYNPLESQDAARAAGAQTYDYWMSGNGNATSAWNPNPRAGFAPDQWDKSR